LPMSGKPIDELVRDLVQYDRKWERERLEFAVVKNQLESELVTVRAELAAAESVNRDLRRRVVMLEVALRQERRRTSDEHSPSIDRAELNGSSVDPQALDKALQHFEDRIPRARQLRCKDVLIQHLKQLQLDPSELAPEPLDETFQKELLSGLRVQPPESDVNEADEGQPGPVEDSGLAQPIGRTQTLRAAQSVRLRSHLDGIRCIAVDPDSGIVVSAGEDGLVKGWRLGAALREGEDVESYISLRGHTEAVLAVACLPQDMVVFSAGIPAAPRESVIHAWRLPDHTYDAYAAKHPGDQRLGRLVGHTDSVWSLAVSYSGRFLASASADTTVRIWSKEALRDAETANEIRSFSVGRDGVVEVPSAVCWLSTDGDRKIVAGCVSGACVVLDSETGVQLSQLRPENSGCIASLRSHPLEPILASAFVDGFVRLYDVRLSETSAMVREFRQHGDAVTCVDINQGASLLATSSHDGLIRLLDVRQGAVLEALEPHHRPKYDELIHCVAFTPFGVVSGGADGDLVVFPDTVPSC